MQILIVCVNGGKNYIKGMNNMNDKKQIQLLKDAIEFYKDGAILEAKDKAIEFINSVTNFEMDFENVLYQKGSKE